MLPLLWCAFHVVKSTSNLFLGRAVDRFGPRPFLFFGWLLYAGVYLAFALATTAWEAWACFPGLRPLLWIDRAGGENAGGRTRGERAEGACVRLVQLRHRIATLPASLIFGALYQVYGALTAFGWGATLALVAVVLLAG